MAAPIRARAATAALLFDFDGTLSPTVDDPAAARPAPGAVDLLDELAARYRTVALVSGRPVAFLAPLVPPSVTLSGQYGLELRRPGGPVESAAGRWAAAVDDAFARIVAAAVDGAHAEPKGLTLTVHYRTRPEAAAAVRALAVDVAARTGLVVHDAKQSVELRPPVDTDKGRVVRALAADADAVVYVGDDRGDLPALAAVADLRAAGAVGLAAAVDGPELPDDVRRAADVLLAGPAGCVDLLRALARH